jgi:hypothetical protein
VHTMIAATRCSRSSWLREGAHARAAAEQPAAKARPDPERMTAVVDDTTGWDASRSGTCARSSGGTDGRLVD